MTTYLSVDLDYWDTPKEMRTGVMKLLERLPSDTIPVRIVNSHDDLVVHAHGCKRLINVDYHSDYTPNPSCLGCGSWAHPVFIGEQCRSYTWYHPHRENCEEGRCDFDLVANESDKAAIIRLLAKDDHPWPKMRWKYGLPTRKDLREVTGAGIAFSTDYVTMDDRKRPEFVGALYRIFLDRPVVFGTSAATDLRFFESSRVSTLWTRLVRSAWSERDSNNPTAGGTHAALRI